MSRSPGVDTGSVRDRGLPARYAEAPAVDRMDLRAALSVAIERIEENCDAFGAWFPGPSSEDLVYEVTDNTDGWTTSFWTGQCWLAHEVTGEDRFRDTAESHLETFEKRLDEGAVTTHDLGFLYTLSAVAGHELTSEKRCRSMALEAADLLVDRFWVEPGLIQAWGDLDEAGWERGRMIVDTMMNLPLLFWASETTGDDCYASVARTHARTNADHVIRADGSTYHTFECDVETGEALGGDTAQGYAADSCWARGQAWAIYGYAIAADYANDDRFLELSAILANYYLDRVEDDHVPRWDFDAPEGEDIRDTSAAAIAACGLDELARQLPAADERVPGYRNAALATLGSLAENYTTEGLDSDGLLTDAAYDRMDGDYDECCIWGDYFYVEGLVRATQHWSRYW